MPRHDLCGLVASDAARLSLVFDVYDRFLWWCLPSWLSPEQARLLCQDQSSGASHSRPDRDGKWWMTETTSEIDPLQAPALALALALLSLVQTEQEHSARKPSWSSFGGCLCSGEGHRRPQLPWSRMPHAGSVEADAATLGRQRRWVLASVACQGANQTV